MIVTATIPRHAAMVVQTKPLSNRMRAGLLTTFLSARLHARSLAGFEHMFQCVVSLGRQLAHPSVQSLKAFPLLFGRVALVAGMFQVRMGTEGEAAPSFAGRKEVRCEDVGSSISPKKWTFCTPKTPPDTGPGGVRSGSSRRRLTAIRLGALEERRGNARCRLGLLQKSPPERCLPAGISLPSAHQKTGERARSGNAERLG